MSLSRRRFIVAGAMAAAGTMLLPQRSHAGAEEADTIVIGSGLSGLYAAMVLGDGGASALVLEGAGKVGGRCQTAYDWDPRIELGGVQIGQMYARVRYIAGRLGIELGEGAHINAPYSFVLDKQLIAAGKWASSPLNKLSSAERKIPPHALRSHYVEAMNPFESLDDWLKPSAAQYDVTLAQWLDQKGASPVAKQLIKATQGGEDPATMGLLRMLQESTYAKVDRHNLETTNSGKDVFERSALVSLHVPGGVSRLTGAMAASLGDRVRLGHKVVAIEMKGDRCEVRCANGKRFSSKAVIAAVPFSVLRNIDIKPGLQGVQADAVSHMPYGNQSQVWLRVKAPYWEDDGIEASMWSDGPFTLIRQQLEYDGKRELISALAFGPNSREVDKLKPEERGRLAIRYIEEVRPSTRGKLEFLGAHSWAQVPLIGGCSHAHLPGRGLAWGNGMAAQHQRLHFAGEHLRRLEVGMESAMETGEIAAMQVMEQLG